MSEHLRPAWVEVDVGAIEHNARLLVGLAAPGGLCAVVKADGYGHGAVPVAQAALTGGASCLAVALVEEGLVLRDAGVNEEILLLSEPGPAAMAEAIAARLTPTLYRLEGVAAAAQAAALTGTTVPVHLKVDTGMHRVGCDPADLLTVAKAIDAAPELLLDGLWTHLAVADDPADPFTDVQLATFDGALGELGAAGITPARRHVANSAGLIAFPKARLDLARCGIALYGHLPAPALARQLEQALPVGRALLPALSLKAQVHLVRDLRAGERVSYGRSYQLQRDSRLAVVPLGYHDGVPRSLQPAGGEVLIGGRRRPIAGTVTMDQILIDCGDDPVRAGDEVVLIGRQGEQEITAEEWAGWLSTIVYEVLCGIGPRVPRLVVSR